MTGPAGRDDAWFRGQENTRSSVERPDQAEARSGVGRPKSQP
jgi:hypothetical protein